MNARAALTRRQQAILDHLTEHEAAGEPPPIRGPMAARVGRIKESVAPDCACGPCLWMKRRPTADLARLSPSQ